MSTRTARWMFLGLTLMGAASHGCAGRADRDIVTDAGSAPTDTEIAVPRSPDLAVPVDLAKILPPPPADAGVPGAPVIVCQVVEGPPLPSGPPGPPPSPPPPPPPRCIPATRSASSPLRRLTNAELRRTLRDVLGTEIARTEFPAESTENGFENRGQQYVSHPLLDAYDATASAAAAHVRANLARFLSCDLVLILGFACSLVGLCREIRACA